MNNDDFGSLHLDASKINHDEIKSDDLLTHEEDLRWMALAITQANKAKDLNEVPVGAIIVADGQLIAKGWNQPISSHDATAHAEVMAIRKAGLHLQNYRIPNTTLYVTIEPCAMCLGAIIHARIARVVYGALEPKAGMLDSNSGLLSNACFNHHVEWVGGVRAQQCSQLISSFFKRRREQKRNPSKKRD